MLKQIIICILGVILMAQMGWAQLGKRVDIGPTQIMVYEWNPGNQALGRFVEKCVKDWQASKYSEAFLIVVGSDAERCWMIEGGIENDAEDFPFFAQLTENFWDGKRSIHSLPPHKFKGNAPDALMRQIWDWDKIGLLPKVESLQKASITYPQQNDEWVLGIKIPKGYRNWYFRGTQQGDCARWFKWEVK